MVPSALFTHECGAEKNVQLLELLELDFLALEWGCPHSTWGFGKGAPWELQEVMGQVLGCETAALMEQLGVAGMHQLALECLGCSWSSGIQLLFYAQPSVRCANLSSQH